APTCSTSCGAPAPDAAPIPAMLTDFFLQLRAAGIPVSIREYLSLLELLCSPAAPTSTEAFYHLARLALVKDETRYDRYDRVFAAFIGQLQARAGGPDIPPDWLVQTFRKQLTDEEKAALEKHGWARLMEMFRERLAESRRNATQVAANGSAPGALRPSATAVITRKASASAVHRPATARP